MKKLFKCFVVSSFLFCFLGVFAQVSPDSRQLKVGVVLSGGGAKGLSHIGVLQELEKNGVRIDYIGGTSMGAIIGALYAVGYSPEEMLQLLEDSDFSAILADKVDRRYKTTFDKEHGEKYALTLPIQNRKIGIPLSLSKGQGVLNLLTKLFEPVDSISDFSKLPIPFYCIGTELATGDMEVFESGSLPLAVRASSSYPTFFQPVEIDNELYIDGGIVANFPIDIMRSKGMDVIIGSDVQSDLLPSEDVHSMVDLLGQVVSYSIYEKNDKQRALVDIYLHPEIEDYAAFTFDDPMAIAELGALEVQKNAVAFKKLAEIQGSMNPIKRKELTLDNKTVEIGEIDIEGNVFHTDSYIIKKLGIKVGDELSYEEFNNRMQSITYQGTVERLSYKIDKNEDDKWVLDVDMKESEISTFLKLGVHYDPLYQTGVLLNLSAYHVLQGNDFFSFDFIIGDNLRYELNYLSDNGKFFGYGFRAYYNAFSDNVATDLLGFNRIDIRYQDFTEQLYAEAFYKNKISLGLGLELKHIKLTSETLPTENDEDIYIVDNSHYFNAFTYLKSDTFDKTMYPKHGSLLDVEFRYYISSSDYYDDFNSFTQLTGNYSAVSSAFDDKLSLQFDVSMGLSTRANSFRFFLGGYGQNYINNFRTLYGYEFGELFGEDFAKVAVELRYEFIPKNHLNLAFNAAQVGNDIFKSGNFLNKIDYGMAVGYGLETFIGPIDLKYGYSPVTKSSQWYFDLGFWF